MRCSRCGETAVVQREGAYFCGRCALTCDWEEIVRLVQGIDLPADDGRAAPAQAKAAARSADSNGEQLPPGDPFA